MKNILLAVFLYGSFLLPAAVADEADEREAVFEVVQLFFAAMTSKNVTQSSALMTADGILYGYRDSSDGLQIVRPTHASYLEGLASRENELIERFWDPTVLLHDRMAVVWTPYDLYIDGEFSHCGIDNFSLLKTDEGWRITGIVFSMEADGCAASPLGPLQRKQ
jgi:hypothetical protein